MRKPPFCFHRWPMDSYLIMEESIAGPYYHGFVLQQAVGKEEGEYEVSAVEIEATIIERPDNAARICSVDFFIQHVSLALNQEFPFYANQQARRRGERGAQSGESYHPVPPVDERD